MAASLLLAFAALAQEERVSDKDYKEGEQFEQFSKKRKLVGAWQISRLKQGALVVRLKTNRLLIQSLLKQGKNLQAEQKRAEMLAINRNTMRAYLDHYTFSKVYFIYSNSSDSLFKGIRSNIFLDTTLSIDPEIEMKEPFYLLAERDYAYNSTIGFVPEDSASLQREKGNAVKEMALVVKNKYGHQLKRPFPYYQKDQALADSDVSGLATISLYINGIPVPFVINRKGKLMSLKNKDNPGPEQTNTAIDYRQATVTVFIPKYLTYPRISNSIKNFNANLHNYYRGSSHIDEDRIDPALKPFLY